MSKIIVCSFHGCMKHDNGRVKHQSLADESELFEIAQEAYDLGLNVMIKKIEKTEDDAIAVLYYSEKGFGQR